MPPSLPVALRKEILSLAPEPFSKLEITIAVSGATPVRTDRLLAGELGLSRNRVHELQDKARSSSHKVARRC